MPFAGFADFDDCLRTMARRGHDEESQRRICGRLQADFEKTAAQDLGRWSPHGVVEDAGGQQAMIDTARSLQRAVIAVFRAQRRWIGDHWRELASPAQRDAILAKAIDDENPSTFAGWIKPIQETLANPLRRALTLGATGAQAETAPMIGFVVDWSASNPAAVEWVEQHGLELARGLNETTIREMRVEIARAVEQGDGAGVLKRRLEDRFSELSGPRSRAIAQTETIRAHTEGALQVYDEADVPQKKWLDLRPNHDDFCAALDGQIVGRRELFEDTFAGWVGMGPPRHISCQCTLRAVFPETSREDTR